MRRHYYTASPDLAGAHKLWSSAVSLTISLVKLSLDMDVLFMNGIHDASKGAEPTQISSQGWQIPILKGT